MSLFLLHLKRKGQGAGLNQTSICVVPSMKMFPCCFIFVFVLFLFKIGYSKKNRLTKHLSSEEYMRIPSSIFNVSRLQSWSAQLMSIRCKQSFYMYILGNPDLYGCPNAVRYRFLHENTQNTTTRHILLVCCCGCA